MQTKPLPEIVPSELRTVRQFLTSLRDEERQGQAPRPSDDPKGAVTLRNGITRARTRSRASADS